ncbi:N-6 DNA methylase [Morganella morganii]|uniref:N-6 DNA methylase n=1 Tax=Morganella morganii TaxID=582 RepID=UPI001BDA39B2|nr:N-6 DNA methylase [Morganella morganii]MBT0384039.1 N-6 DNA methylase [Morganella morganii subsp. morganii]
MKNNKKNVLNLSNKKNYAQYYTNSSLGEALIKSIPREIFVEKIVDFSAGKGALLLQCKVRYPGCSLHGIDIDAENIRFLKRNEIKATLIDATTSNINKLVNVESYYCLSVGNPPFKRISINKHICELFSFYNIPTGNEIRAENYFLLYSLHIIKNEGGVVFIVPESIISGEKNKAFRAVLVERFKVIEVKEIPRGMFPGTEAKTFIISIRKSGCTDSVRLSYFGDDERYITISDKEFIERSDFKFYAHAKMENKIPLFCFKVLRGNASSKVARYDSDKFIHTTSFKGKVNYFSNNEKMIKESHENIYGIPGDIVIPRVGSRSLGKVGIINDGYFKLSDCVFSLRPSNNKEKNKIISFLNSNQGRDFIRSISKGIGASYITLKDINLLSYDNAGIS